MEFGDFDGSPLFKDLKFHDADPKDIESRNEWRKTVEGRLRAYDRGEILSEHTKQKKNPWQSNIPIQKRRFVSWDGESVGISTAERVQIILGQEIKWNATKQGYVLFGNSDGDYITGKYLTTYECLNLITTKADKDAIHFGFAFDFDVNMILRDLSRNKLTRLRATNKIRWQHFTIEYIPKKWFQVTDRQTRRTVKIWDTWSFFSTSAVKAWKQYGVPVSQAVIDGKEQRGTQTYEQLWTEIYPYWQEENQAYVALMEKLRESLHAADLFISSWHGPGAIASYSMEKHGIKHAMAPSPSAVNEAAQYAYGGGRFEMFKLGRANTTVYAYDINSAYPYAIAQLPNLVRGHWRHVQSPRRIARFGVYRVSFRARDYKFYGYGGDLKPGMPLEDAVLSRVPMPFLHRSKRGNITFPMTYDKPGWVWSPELHNQELFPPGELVIHEGWEFIEDDETDRPFAWIAESYDVRLRYKNDKSYGPNGNPAQLALKLQLNSMYGKMAQRVGWNEEKRLPPKWHQLEWAGWVTSMCRAMVYRAGILAGDNLIAYETDALFTTKPMSDVLEIGAGLGQWGEEIFDDMVYLQSGVRFGLMNGEWQSKYRGFDAGSITIDQALSVLARSPDEWVLQGTTHRFIGFPLALRQSFDTWQEFQKGKGRELAVNAQKGKRVHKPEMCRACRDGIPATEGFHDAVNGAWYIRHPSEKHMLPWKDAASLLPQDLADEEKYTVLE